MRARRSILTAMVCAAAVAAAQNVPAQNTGTDQPLPPAAHTFQPSRTPLPGPGANPDASLEIMRRASQPTPAAEASSPSEPSDSGALNGPPQHELPPLPTSGPPSSMTASNPRPALPYVGISVQRIESHSTPGKDVVGLEIVSVDPDSPAEHAGLKGRRGMSKLGASGATAGALMAPLDIVAMPLLKKTGQLGRTGDLILAVDDRRIASEVDLETALEDSKPGDTIYLTVKRLVRDGAQQTRKIPVKLGSPEQSTFP